MSDRLGDYGLVGAAVIADDEIAGFAMSCRALGMGVEHRFLTHILDERKGRGARLRGRIIPTSRNMPVRNLYRDNGFTEIEPGFWQSAHPAG